MYCTLCWFIHENEGICYLFGCSPEVLHSWNHCDKIALRFGHFTSSITGRIPFACFVWALRKTTQNEGLTTTASWHRCPWELIGKAPRQWKFSCWCYKQPHRYFRVRKTIVLFFWCRQHNKAGAFPSRGKKKERLDCTTDMAATKQHKYLSAAENFLFNSSFVWS